MKLFIGILFLFFGFQGTFAADYVFYGEQADYGPIPDGNSSFYYRSYADPREIRINVGNLQGSSVRKVSVLFAADHPNMSDLRVTLVAPDGRYLVLFETLGSASDSLFTSNLNANYNYNFTDDTPTSWWDAANIGDADIGANNLDGYYRTVVPVDMFPYEAPEVSSLNAMFKTANPEGTWILRVEDGLANHTGAVTFAMLTLSIDISDVDPSGPQTRVVTSNHNEGPGSLRQAILDANDGDKIEFDIPNDNVINLFNPLPDITKDLTIVGRPDNLILLQMATGSGGRIINIPEGHGNTVTINNLRFRLGRNVDKGGCIFNGGKLFLSRTYVFSCTANSLGGGIYNAPNSELYMINSGVSDNTANNGSGILIENSKASIIQSTIVNNIGSGIGIYGHTNSSAYLELYNSSIIGNSRGLAFIATEGGKPEGVLSNNLFAGQDNIYETQDASGAITVTSKGFNLTTDDGRGHLDALSDKINANAGVESVETILGITTYKLSNSSDAIDAGRSVAYFKSDFRGEPNARIVDFPDILAFFGSFLDFPNPNSVSGDESDIGAFEKQPPPTFDINVTVNGLATGNSLVVANGEDSTTFTTNQTQTLSSLGDGTAYNVYVNQPPTSPNQTCSVTGGTNDGAGIIAGADVAITITCVTNQYTVGGNVSGLLRDNAVVLQNNQTGDKTITSNGAFVFDAALDDESSYSVTVKTQPGFPLQTCTVTNGSGSLAGSNVNNIEVVCEYVTANDLIYRYGFEDEDPNL